MKTMSEKLAPISIYQLSSGQLIFNLFFFLSSPVLFSTCQISKKRLFDKAFNINSQLLAKDYTRKKVDLILVVYHCLEAVKANRVWQQ